MTDPAETGRRVLEALAGGRALAIERARERSALLAKLVAAAACRDCAAGKPSRGRAGRVARLLRGLASERHVKRILDAQSSASDSLRFNRDKFDGMESR